MGPIIHVYFDLVAALIILLIIFLTIALIVFLTSWYWRRKRGLTIKAVPWQNAFDSLPEGVIVSDGEGRVLWCNAEAHRLLPLIPPDESIVRILRRVAKVRKPELVRIKPSAELELQVRAIPFGPCGEVISILSDVSERRRQEEFYRSFIDNVSHELLTPLAAIAGHIANIQECSIEEEESWRRSQQIIEKEVRRLTRLTSNLLLLSHLESGAPLRIERVNIGAVVEESVSQLISLAEGKRIQLSIQSPPKLPRIQGDRDRLKQVFINLLDNAMKYSPEGAEVRVRLTTDEAYIIAEVSDTGYGIPEEDLPHIFEKMYRVERGKTRAVEGSGLGLSIVKRIVELHGGEVSVRSVLGKGSTFTVRLPLEPINR